MPPWTAGTNGQDVISSQVATGGNTVQVDEPRITSVGAAGPMLPCDIYAAAHTPCVAAYSTVRALYGSYEGPLYQVQRASDQAVSNIGLLRPGGTADAAAQEAFCAGTSCTITMIYDQSGHENDLAIEDHDKAASATALPVTIGGHTVYGVYIRPGMGYRHPAPSSGVAVGDEPEGMYMVTGGVHVNRGCCFDFGNVEAKIHTMALVTWTLSTSRPNAISGIAPQMGRGCRRTWRTACFRAIKAPINSTKATPAHSSRHC
jgi:hypothetical protein